MRCEACDKIITEFSSFCRDCDDQVSAMVHEDDTKELAKLRELLESALPHIECKTTEQSQLITAIGEALD